MSSAFISIRHGQDSLNIRPLLSFTSRSPDQFWTNFASRKHQGIGRQLIGFERHKKIAKAIYKDDGKSFLEIQSKSDHILEITAFSKLPTAVYSHLNDFCRIEIISSGNLSLQFSKTKPIAIKSKGYPAGKPARLAYLGKNNTLFVVEATDAEKGPFGSLSQFNDY